MLAYSELQQCVRTCNLHNIAIIKEHQKGSGAVPEQAETFSKHHDFLKLYPLADENSVRAGELY